MSANTYRRYRISYAEDALVFVEVVAESKAHALRIAKREQPGERRVTGRSKRTRKGFVIHSEKPA